ncbi:uncharacterized protein LOC129590492 isoform X2 [Paramacrobiotus metropolitanus]|uniref:uncharacterized protein LOC129590492 isoform X2 n=1 Tax=Paramacrobiotus metropolitanus TaxID=2943436 RepID=UPI0024458E55|nr:uncharacterized protein LOC129590492 isoform X2 [Paramacrobiotus metropolitanus]
MRTSYRKTSSLEPNFSFAEAVPGSESTQLGIEAGRHEAFSCRFVDSPPPPTAAASHSRRVRISSCHEEPNSPDSSSAHSIPSTADFVLHKTTHGHLFNYGSCAEGISTVIAARLNGADYDLSGDGAQRCLGHLRAHYGLYIVLAFGLVSVSGCIAAGIALSAVQPHVVHVPLTTTTAQPATIAPNDLLTRILSHVREASGLQEVQLELRNTTLPTDADLILPDPLGSTPPTYTSTLQSGTTSEGPPPNMALLQNADSPSVYVLPAPTSSRKQKQLEKIFPSIPTWPNVRVFHQSDLFGRGGLVISDPKYHDLNITFDDPFQPAVRGPAFLPKPGRTLNLAKRSANYINGHTKRFPVIKLARFTMTQSLTRPSSSESPEGTVAPINPKALLPHKEGTCAEGFEWNSGSGSCADVDECVQMGVRACGINSECTNTPGSFVCRCSPGFRVDPKSLVCLDIDECKESNGECSPLALCENMPGGFLCKCMEGFYGNGIVCEIDASGVADRHNTKPLLPCQTTFPPRHHQVISNPYFPEPFPVLSRYKFCIDKMHAACKTGIKLQNFLPSSTNHQDFDYLKIGGKVFTGTDLNGQTLWLLDSRNVPMEMEFSTDSEMKGNRFTMEIVQEICGPLLSVPECPELLRISPRSISSMGPNTLPFHPTSPWPQPGHYLDNIACTTALYPPTEACGMELYFHEFSLEGPRETCPFDYLEINDDRLCGNMKNELREVIFPRNTPKIPIIFATDATFVARGFNISYTWITECVR